ncbi:ATP-binding protein [Pseudooctadecabacter jejudonensis]|uniref:histidine kinase n=1 Tax=Pseudooctadecabacter jejudonensis TaxID=1391910 RepID=A0A1Y5RJ03_9RHOB|nr:ATP-binding protein [Pseudooctadecabacter jejudonensis]SLN15998.1 Alkaline phosphatase synthesis sensor protein PhoR [Pseudooctadecabacter jejudonensis]
MSDVRSLIASLPNPVIVVGGDHRIRAINSPAQRLVGTDCNGWHYVTALRQPALLDAVEQGLSTGGQQTTRYLGNDGARPTTWDVSVRPVMLNEGQVVVLSFQDITALEDAGEMRRGFVANVSHEMRTPLTSLLGFIETLRGPARNDPEAQQRFLGIMEQEAGRMHNLVEDLLSLSRVEDQERMRPTGAVALDRLIGEVGEALAPVAAAAQVDLIYDLPQTKVEVLGDWGQLWQVVSNLVENAIKYGGDGAQVTVALTQPAHDPVLRASGVRLIVRDEGEGIAAHHIARLTDRFYRVDTHRSREIGGTGLGLAIVKHIINRHRGRLRIESQLGQGSVFTVILPTGAAAPAE